MLRPRHVEILSHLKIQLRSLSEKGLLSVPQPEVLELERWQERKTKRERERARAQSNRLSTLSTCKSFLERLQQVQPVQALDPRQQSHLET